MNIALLDVDFTDVLLIIIALLLVVIVAYIVSNGWLYTRSRRRTENLEDKPAKIITVISCKNNDYTIEREFQEGDFIGKVADKCPKCGAEMIISKIYTIPLESGQKPYKQSSR
jgi:hypothetical protein